MHFKPGYRALGSPLRRLCAVQAHAMVILAAYEKFHSYPINYKLETSKTLRLMEFNLEIHSLGMGRS